VEEAGTTPDEKALYNLIRLRTLAALLADAVYAERKAVLEAEVNGRAAEFMGRGSTLISKGWKTLTMPEPEEDEDESEKSEASNPVPQLHEGDALTAHEGHVLGKLTKPPKRFTEAALVKELEKRGIGRPATYAAILDKIIQQSQYLRVIEKERHLLPTPLGEVIVDHLCPAFSFIEYEFTRGMEESLDRVAEGQESYSGVVSQLHARLSGELANFKSKAQASLPDCPCGQGKLHLVKGKNGAFWGCSGYKNGCRNSYPDKDGKPDFEARKISEHKCAVCGAGLIKRQNRKDGGVYWKCSEFSNCGKTFPDNNGVPDFTARNQPSAVHKCMVCGKPLTRLKNKKDGVWFWGCSDFPACKGTYPDLNGSPDYTAK
jgi:DNA topoisomerase-1